MHCRVFFVLFSFVESFVCVCVYVLFPLVLFCFVLSHFASSSFVLSCFICFVLVSFVSFRVVRSPYVSFVCNLSYCLIWPHLASFRFFFCFVFSFGLVLSRFFRRVFWFVQFRFVLSSASCCRLVRCFDCFCFEVVLLWFFEWFVMK